jgi:hypothetical protein
VKLAKSWSMTSQWNWQSPDLWQVKWKWQGPYI